MIPQVVASERGAAQPVAVATPRRGCRAGVMTLRTASGTGWKARP